MHEALKHYKHLFTGIIISLLLLFVSDAAITAGQPLQISGKVLYEPSTRRANVELLYSNGTRADFTTTNANGDYTLLAPSGVGYKLIVTKLGYLSYTINNLDIRAGYDIETVNLRQMAGDINGDGCVNAEDLTHLGGIRNEKKAYIDCTIITASSCCCNSSFCSRLFKNNLYSTRSG